MNNAVASALVQAAHRVEARLEEALAGVGLSIAKFETLSILVSQDRPIRLSELASKLVCVRSNVTQLVDRLETEGLVKRADDPADRRALRAEVTALGRKRQAAGTALANGLAAARASVAVTYASDGSSAEAVVTAITASGAAGARLLFPRRKS